MRGERDVEREGGRREREETYEEDGERRRGHGFHEIAKRSGL